MPTMSYGEALRSALIQSMGADPGVFIYGQGINDPTGFFGSTRGLANMFGNARCFDAPLSEEALIGMGVGAALLGRRPIYTALRIDFLMLAMNQIVNHAAKWPAASGYQCTVPLTIRCIIGKDWGQGSQHSGAYHAMFAGVPGLDVVLPATPNEAAGLLLAAIQSDCPTVFVEAKPLYGVSSEVELPIKALPLGKARVTRSGRDVTLVAISYAVGLAEVAADVLRKYDVVAEVLDLRTIAPLDEAAIIESVAKTGRVAIFDVGWQHFSLASEVARVLSMSNAVVLSCPLISLGQKWEHTPGGCFREHEHYPNLDQVVDRLLEELI